VERALLQDRVEAEIAADEQSREREQQQSAVEEGEEIDSSPLRGLVSEIEGRYR